MLHFYTFSPLEVLSFSESYGVTFIGFFFKEKKEKEKLLKEVKVLLDKWDILTIEAMLQLLTENICFVHIFYKGLIYKLNSATIQEYLSSEENFTPFIGKFISFLSRKEETSLELLKQSNLLDFLSFRVKEKAESLKLTKRAKSLETFIDFHASDKAKREEEEGVFDPFAETSVEDLEETDFFFSEPLAKLEDYSWFNYFFQEELVNKEIVKKFPLFKGAEQDLQMQSLFLQFSSLEKGIDSGFVIKSWELYKKEVDFLTFLSFTNLCQSKLWEIYNEQE